MSRLLLPLICRPLMTLIKKAAKHAVPVIKERMLIIDAAVEKKTEPVLPVGILMSRSMDEWADRTTTE